MTRTPDTPEIDVAHERAQMLDVTNAILNEVVRKLLGDGRIKDVENAKARQGYMNAAWRGLKEKRLQLDAIENASEQDVRLDAIEEYLGLEDVDIDEIIEA